MEGALSKTPLPTECQNHGKIFRSVLLKAASHHIPSSGRHRLYDVVLYHKPGV